jgi:hypothetical protein
MSIQNNPLLLEKPASEPLTSFQLNSNQNANNYINLISNATSTVYSIADSSDQSTSADPSMEWFDLIDLADVKGWEEEYKEAVRVAIAANNGKPTLPRLTEKMEMGIKAVTQRLPVGSLYPPESVRSAEIKFFEYATYHKLWVIKTLEFS